MAWDGESLNFQSNAAGKSIKVSVLGDLNITGDIYLNGELFQAACTPVATSSTSWNDDGGDYSSRYYREPSKTLDGVDSGTSLGAWLGYASASERYLIYGLGSVIPIRGIQIDNEAGTYGVQETLLQSGTSLTGPWTTRRVPSQVRRVPPTEPAVCILLLRACLVGDATFRICLIRPRTVCLSLRRLSRSHQRRQRRGGRSNPD